MSRESPAAGSDGEPRPVDARLQTEFLSDSAETRPLLGEAQLTVLGRYGTESAVQAGELLFTDGDERYDLIVVLEGTVEIVEHHGDPRASRSSSTTGPGSSSARWACSPGSGYSCRRGRPSTGACCASRLTRSRSSCPKSPT